MSNSKINDGGAAFPVTQSPVMNNGESAVYPEAGMSLRDYFAAKAMQGLLANSGGPIQANGMSGWGTTNCNEKDIAGYAYFIADAMIAARNTPSEQ